MKRKLFSIFIAAFLLCGAVSADWIYNPFTGRLDYYEPTVAGVTTFLGLTDAPAAYTAAGLFTLRVNTGGTAVEFYDLRNVENTALSTWAGTSNITTLGTIATGVWNGTAIPTAYGGTAKNSSGWTGVVYTSGGNWFNEAQLGLLRGGTGINGSAAVDGSLYIGHTLPAQGFSLGTLTGTANQITVTNGASSITLSLPQDIAAASSPAFTGLTLSGLNTAGGIVQTDGSGVLSTAVDLPTGTTIGTKYVYRVDGTDVAVADGGTNIGSYAIGDILYASTTGVLSKLPDVAVGQYLASGGVNTAPAYAALNQAAVAGLTTASTPSFAGVTAPIYNHGAFTAQTPSAAFTVDWSTNHFQQVTITGTTLDITFTNPAGPCRLVLIVIQGDGDDTIDWSNEADIKCPGGVYPVLSTTSAYIDVVTFIWTGTVYLCIANYDFR